MIYSPIKGWQAIDSPLSFSQVFCLARLFMRPVVLALFTSSLLVGPVSALPLVELQQIAIDQSPDRQKEMANSSPTHQRTQTQIAEDFVDLVAQGKFDNARLLLNPTLREGWTVAEMRDDWVRLQKVMGEYEQRLTTEVADENLVLVNLQFEKATDNLLVIFDDQHQISGVDFPLQLPRL